MERRLELPTLTAAAVLVGVTLLAACPASAPPGPASADEGPACRPPPAGAPVATATPAPPIAVVLGRTGEPGPVGEVPFNHKAHAGDCKIPCLACHVYADRAPVAGLPSGKKCMGCHKFVAKEKPAVQLLAARFRAGQPLRWERVFTLPDFISFSHRRHLLAKPPVGLKPLDCKDCHGDIAAQKVVRQEQPFTMGRCLDCHEKRQASRDCLACHK